MTLNNICLAYHIITCIVECACPVWVPVFEYSVSCKFGQIKAFNGNLLGSNRAETSFLETE